MNLGEDDLTDVEEVMAMSNQACAAAQEAKRLALESADYVERANNEANGGERIRLRDEASAIYERAVRHKQDTGWFYQAHTASPHWTHTDSLSGDRANSRHVPA